MGMLLSQAFGNRTDVCLLWKMLGRNLSGFCRCFKFQVLVNSARNVYMYSPEPFHPIPDREPRLTTAEEAVSVITTGNNHYLDLELVYVVHF